MIEKIISGGQLGADLAGWKAAREFGIPTGGWMPHGYATEHPSGHGTEYHPEFAELYWATELEPTWKHKHLADQYRERTRRNIQAARLTILFGDHRSRGSQLAHRLFREKVAEPAPDPGANYLRDGWIPVSWGWTHGVNWKPEDVAGFIAKMPHSTVNIAGNRHSKDPGLGRRVEEFLAEVFRITNGGTE
jgi:Circularly permutated YpsA SLOG family